MTDFTKYDAIVVGCGLVGGIVSRYIAETLKKKVLILERREHIAGNLYDYKDENGILVHQYGPHAFHTFNRRVRDFVLRFGEWFEYKVTCMAQIDGKFTPSPFNFQTIDDFYSKEDAKKLKSHILKKYNGVEKTTIVEMLKSEDPVIKEYANFLFEKDYAPYTAKQWGISPSEIDLSVLKRVPILFSYKNGCFDDTYQIMPKQGYTEFFRNIISHPQISVRLNTDAIRYFSVRDGKLLLGGQECQIPVIYTGPADELMDKKYGALPYRSLRFEIKTEWTASYQDAPIVAYPQEEQYTRITEYTKLPEQPLSGRTVIGIEYPQAYISGSTEPYYPILTDSSQRLYRRYQEELDKVPNLYLCGRLADFKYYNMDQAVARALEVCDMLKI